MYIDFSFAKKYGQETLNTAILSEPETLLSRRCVCLFFLIKSNRITNWYLKTGTEHWNCIVLQFLDLSTVHRLRRTCRWLVLLIVTFTRHDVAASPGSCKLNRYSSSKASLPTWPHVARQLHSRQINLWVDLHCCFCCSCLLLLLILSCRDAARGKCGQDSKESVLGWSRVRENHR